MVIFHKNVNKYLIPAKQSSKIFKCLHTIIKKNLQKNLSFNVQSQQTKAKSILQ